MSDSSVVDSETGEPAGDETKPDTVDDDTESGTDEVESAADEDEAKTGDPEELETELGDEDSEQSESSSIVEESKKPNYDGSPLIEYVSEELLILLHDVFKETPKQKLTAEAFRSALDSVLGIIFEDCDFQLLFRKMQYQRSGFISWDDIVSHLILEYKEKDKINMQVNLETPIDGPPRNLKTHHRHPVNRLIFCPALRADREINYRQGCYASVSHEGLINTWNLDLELVQSATSKTVFLKVGTTWVTDIVMLPDFNIFCVSSTECDLRFYDMSLNLLELRLDVYSLPAAVVSMHYAWSRVAEGDGHLVTGDMAGSVNVYTLSAANKGAFHHAPGLDMRAVLFEQVARGELKGMVVKEYRAMHCDWVRQVYYNKSLSCVVSCAVSDENSLVMRDGQGDVHNYYVAQGVKCFDVQEDAHLIASGGPDCLVRLWNLFVSYKAVCVFRGHHAGVIAVAIQGDIQRVISLSQDRCIKVWDIAFQNCIQTYTQLPASLGHTQPLTTLYNPLSHMLIVAGMHFSVISCGALVPEELSDGFSHASDVTCIVYNPLFQVLVSVGDRGMITVWNLWKGQRKQIIKLAHSKLWFGRKIPVAITAATFDPTYHLLMTGAHDGTVKMWNFHTGSCVRHFSIEPDKEVVSLIWLKGRILATGWNRHVEEWEDSARLSLPKCWEMRHTSDILAAAACPPQCLATSSYAGELILWRMETGQAYKRHSVGNPTLDIKLEYVRPGQAASTTSYRPETRGSRRSTSPLVNSPRFGSSRMSIPSSSTSRSRVFRWSVSQSAPTMRNLAAHALLFLRARTPHPSVGTLLVSVENGLVQVWSHHSAGGFLSAFQAAHRTGDYVVSMATDNENKFLFTGTAVGYVKVWLLTNYRSEEMVYLVMPVLRLQFPFLWHDRVEGKAKRAARYQPLPMLLSSYRAHLRAVNMLVFLAPAEILISCSSDYSVRLWNLAGRYIGTLGSSQPWTPISSMTSPGPDYPYRMPPDIRRVGSYTTIRVLNGGFKWWETKRNITTLADLDKERGGFEPSVIKQCVHGKALQKPWLGNCFKMPPRPEIPPALPRIDASCAHIPVFCHVALAPEVSIVRPGTPPAVKERRLKSRIIAADSSTNVSALSC